MQTIAFTVLVLAGLGAGLVIGLASMPNFSNNSANENIHLALNTGGGTLAGAVVGWMATWFCRKDQ